MCPVLSALPPARNRCPSDDDVVPSPQCSASGSRNWVFTSWASASEYVSSRMFPSSRFLIWGGLARIWLLNQAAWCVGSICHKFGARPFTTQDQSANNWLVAFATGGEGLQNNHHAFPGSALHGLRWWEPDLSGLVIRTCQFVGLVWDVRRASPRAVAEGRNGAVMNPDVEDSSRNSRNQRTPLYVVHAAKASRV